MSGSLRVTPASTDVYHHQPVTTKTTVTIKSTSFALTKGCVEARG